MLVWRKWNINKTVSVLGIVYYSVSQQKRTVTINITNAQHSLIIFGTEKPYSILH